MDFDPASENIYTDISQVPKELWDASSPDNKIYIDVLDAGAKFSYTLDRLEEFYKRANDEKVEAPYTIIEQEAKERGLIKNHWICRFLLASSVAQDARQVSFGFEPAEEANSDVVRPGSIQSCESGSTDRAGIESNFIIKYRLRIGASNSSQFSACLELASGTTFGALLESIQSHGMLPFQFASVSGNQFGCRDAISQFAAVWMQDGLMLNGINKQSPFIGEHIYDLLPWRYSLHPSGAAGEERASAAGPYRRQLEIDRAIWPEGYAHVEDEKLLYKEETVAQEQR